MNFHKLKVSALDKPIEDATTITFDVPEELKEEFNFKPGQYLNIDFVVNGEKARRSYSLNSCPNSGEPHQVTVKRVKGGLVSNFVQDYLKVGDVLEVMTPDGRFCAELNEEHYKTYFLFAAGSGITPVFSILKSVLIKEPHSRVHLFYGNQNQDTIIFKQELEDLGQKYGERLNVVHILSDPKVWTTWEQWDGKTGMIDPNGVEELITENPPVAQSTEYFICGPGNMNTTVRDKLREIGVPKEFIHIEQFNADAADMDDSIKAFPNAKLTAHLYNQKFEFEVPEGKTILQVLKDANVDPPFSCESGICSTCFATIQKGKAEMKANMVLDDSEVEAGKVLTCQAIPTTEEIEIKY